MWSAAAPHPHFSCAPPAGAGHGPLFARGENAAATGFARTRTSVDVGAATGFARTRTLVDGVRPPVPRERGLWWAVWDHRLREYESHQRPAGVACLGRRVTADFRAVDRGRPPVSCARGTPVDTEGPGRPIPGVHCVPQWHSRHLPGLESGGRGPPLRRVDPLQRVDGSWPAYVGTNMSTGMAMATQRTTGRNVTLTLWPDIGHSHCDVHKTGKSRGHHQACRASVRGGLALATQNATGKKRARGKQISLAWWTGAGHSVRKRGGLSFTRWPGNGHSVRKSRRSFFYSVARQRPLGTQECFYSMARQ